jgi:hypothetical protein
MGDGTYTDGDVQAVQAVTRVLNSDPMQQAGILIEAGLLALQAAGDTREQAATRLALAATFYPGNWDGTINGGELVSPEAMEACTAMGL